MNQHEINFLNLLSSLWTDQIMRTGQEKPGEVPVPGKNPEIIPPSPPPVTWPKREPEIQPEREPLTTPPTAPPEVPKPPQGNSGVLYF